MKFLMTDEGPKAREGRAGFEGTLNYKVSTSDVQPLVRGELQSLKRTLKSARNAGVNTITKYHYDDLIARIDAVLDPK